MNLILTKTLLFSFLLFANFTMAQSPSELATAYSNERRESDPIYNGLEYSRYPFYIHSGFPYFTSDTMSSGSVVYEGVLYNDLRLMYDMVLDELIANDFSGKNMIKLVKQKVDSFSIYGQQFISIKTGGRIPAGYYQLIRNGGNEMLKKEVKTVVNKVKFGEDLQKNIESKVSYYTKRDGNYIISTSPSDK